MNRASMPKGLTYYRKGGGASKKSKGSKICPAGKAWAKRTFDTYPSAYAVRNMSRGGGVRQEIAKGCGAVLNERRKVTTYT
jgi:hypothetical protein